MIELLLQAEDALTLGLLDAAERIYWQAVERDAANAIAIVGLSRVALERGDERTALSFARKALQVDPENATARRMLARLEEVIAHRGDPIPDGVADLGAAHPRARAGAAPIEPSAAAAPGAPPSPSTPEPSAAASPGAPAPRTRRGLLGRLLGRS